LAKKTLPPVQKFTEIWAFSNLALQVIFYNIIFMLFLIDKRLLSSKILKSHTGVFSEAKKKKNS
jgi:hypothetical protein